MNILLVGMLVTIAWAHARLTVVAAIHQTQTPEQMLQHMQRDTWWSVVWVVLGYFTLGAFSMWITLYALARCLFLLLTNWHAVCNNFGEIKRLLNEN